MTVPIGHGPDAFGNALRHARRTYLLSQRALATRLGSRTAASPGSRAVTTASRSSPRSRSTGRSASASACCTSSPARRATRSSPAATTGRTTARSDTSMPHCARFPPMLRWGRASRRGGACATAGERPTGRTSGGSAATGRRRCCGTAGWPHVRQRWRRRDPRDQRGRGGLRRRAPRGRGRDGALRRHGHGTARRRRHQLPQRHRARQERRVVRRQGRRARSTARPLYPDPLQRDHRPDRRPGHHLRAQRRRRRSPTCSPTSSPSSTTATWARRPRARAGSATPAGTCWSRSTRPRRAAGVRRRCAAQRARCRSAPCCSTRGPSSSTTSATRAPSPTSTCPTSTAGSPWPPGCSSSPTGSSPRSATGCRPALADQRRRRRPTTRPADQRAGARDLPRRAVRRRRLVAHRPLRLDLRPAARARHHLARRARRRCCAPSTAPRSPRGWATATRPARCAGSTTRCSRCSATRYVDLHGNAHRRASLETLGLQQAAGRLESGRVSIPGGRVRQDDVARVATRASPARLIEKEPAMADTYVYLIHEGDWDSDAYLGGAPAPTPAPPARTRAPRRRRRHGRVVPRAQGLPAGRRRPRRPRRRGRRPAELPPRRHRRPPAPRTAPSRTPSTPTARSPTRPR